MIPLKYSQMPPGENYHLIVRPAFEKQSEVYQNDHQGKDLENRSFLALT